MLQEIIEIICEYIEVGPETVTAGSSLRNDLGATSFDLMNIAVALEEKYGVSVPDHILPRINTVGDIMVLLDKR